MSKGTAEWRKRLSPERKEKIKAESRVRKAAWYLLNKAKADAASRSWRLRNAHTYAVHVLSKRYDISKAEASILIADKEKGCKVCGRKSKRMHVDHDHKTGRVRGVLCHGCNATLGFAADNPAVLKQLARYVETGGMITKEETQ